MKLSALAILSYLVVWSRAYSSSPEDGHGVSRERDVNILFAYLRPSGGVVSRVNPAQSYNAYISFRRHSDICRDFIEGRPVRARFSSLIYIKILKALV